MMDANHRIENWGGTIVSYPQKLVRPTSIDQISAIVNDPDHAPSPVRAVGSNHSTTECGVANGGTLLEMSGINHIHIDPEKELVTAGAGAIYIDVVEKLAKAGYQLFVNPEIGNVSIGSACCGGTKDASMYRGYPQVSSYCTSMTVVRPNGKIETIDDEAALKIMRCSYGLLGVIYEATFQIKRTVPIRFSHESFTIEEFAANFDEIKTTPKSMMLYVLPFLDRIVVEYREEMPKTKINPGDRWKWKLRNWVWSTGAPAFGRICTALVPFKGVRYTLIDLFNLLVVKVLTGVLHGNASDPKDQVIRYPESGGIGMYTFSIWAFEEAGFPDTLRAYAAFCREYYATEGYRCNMLNVGYRFAQDPGSILSYSFQGPKWSLDVVSTGDAGWDRFVWSYNRFCGERGGKPLFNQTRSITPAQAQTAFGPLLDQFRDEVAQGDPQGRFRNRYFAWLLSLSVDDGGP